jgi:hypothetical protein
MVPMMLTTIPQPPVDVVMPKTAETIFNVFIFIPLGIALALALRKLLKGQGPLLLYCILGGALAACFEPMVDVLGLVFLKEHGALGTFTILDRTMPLYICFVYPWYVGGLGYFAYKLFKRGAYLYYGHQPFNFWGLPLWWGFVNPVMPMVAGALIFHIRPHLNTAWKLPAVIACIPMADGIANGATAWPMWASLNQADVSYVWTYLASLVTLGLALFSVWIIGLSVVGRGEVAHPESETLWQKLKAIAAPASQSAVPDPVTA